MMDEYLFEIKNDLLIDINLNNEEILDRLDLWKPEEEGETIPFL